VPDRQDDRNSDPDAARYLDLVRQVYAAYDALHAVQVAKIEAAIDRVLRLRQTVI
jgi:hypothetical protein